MPIKEAKNVYIPKGKYRLDVSEKVSQNPARCGVEQVVEAKGIAQVVVERLIQRLGKIGISATSEMATVRSNFGAMYVSIIVTCDSQEYEKINDIAKIVAAME